MRRIGVFGPRVLGEDEYQREQKMKRKSAQKYGLRVRGEIEGDKAAAPARRTPQEPRCESNPENPEAVGQEPAERPPEEAGEEPPSDPDAVLKRAITAFVLEHPACSESLVRRSVRGSTRRIRRAIRELQGDGVLEDRGGSTGKRLHVKHADE